MVFVSICENASTATFLRAASSLESATREQRALLIEEQDPRVRIASSAARILKLPNTFYRKHGLIKAQ